MPLRWKYERFVRLYTREEGSFADLPLYTRALAAQVLKIADADGRIPLGGREPWRAIAWAARANRSDRRLLRRDVAVLLEDGYLVVDGDELLVRNFVPAQAGFDPLGPDGQPATKRPRRRHDPDANGPRPGHDGATKDRQVRDASSVDKTAADNDRCTTGARPVHDGDATGARTNHEESPSAEDSKGTQFAPYPPSLPSSEGGREARAREDAEQAEAERKARHAISDRLLAEVRAARARLATKGITDAGAVEDYPGIKREIHARLVEGFTESQLLRVVACREAEAEELRHARYLRPSHAFTDENTRRKVESTPDAERRREREKRKPRQRDGGGGAVAAFAAEALELERQGR